jgi:hypothetical protein
MGEKEKGYCEVVIWIVWGVAALCMTVLLALQSYDSWNEHSKEYLATRMLIASILILPNIGILAGVGRVKGKYARLRSRGALIAVVSSAIYCVSAFLFFYLEPLFYPGHLVDGFAVFSITLIAGQAIVAWALTNLAAR